MNRIEKAIERLQGVMPTLTPEKVASLEESCRIDDIFEFAKYQETKSLAQMHEVISLDEAMTIFNRLGSTPDHFNNLPLYERAAVMLILGELVAWRAKVV